MLNASYYARLANDPTFNTFFAATRSPDVINKGILPELQGFDGDLLVVNLDQNNLVETLPDYLSFCWQFQNKTVRLYFLCSLLALGSNPF